MFDLSHLVNYLKEKNAVIIVTGVSGWIGRYLLEFLNKGFGNDFSKYIIPVSHSKSEMVLSDRKSIKCIKFNEMSHLNKDKNYVFFHLSFLTKDRIDEKNLDDYRQKNLKIRETVIDFCLNFNVISLIYVSSGAVYKDLGILVKSFEESPYGFLKLEDEEIFSKIMIEQQQQIIIPRIFNIAGSYINKFEIYALSNFLMQAIKNKKIEITADCLTYRSYVHLEELILLVLSMIMDESIKNIIFETKGEELLEMEDLASLIFNFLNIEKKIIRPELNNQKTKNTYYCVSDEYKKLCDQYSLENYTVNKMINDTYEFLRTL